MVGDLNTVEFSNWGSRGSRSILDAPFPPTPSRHQRIRRAGRAGRAQLSLRSTRVVWMNSAGGPSDLQGSPGR